MYEFPIPLADMQFYIITELGCCVVLKLINCRNLVTESNKKNTSVFIRNLLMHVFNF